jgi:thymidylate synthase (FAD)
VECSVRQTEIRVYPIAKTHIDTADAARWLRDAGVADADAYLDAIPDEMSDAEALVGLAAKRCYMSFEVGLNPNVSKIRKDWFDYLENILKSGHGSVTEHATWTWAIEGCTRVFTAEMNRHRAGMAISEGSLRYIRFDDVPFWMPLSLRDSDGDDPETRERKHASRVVFEHAFKNAEGAYRSLCAIWEIDKGDFHRKKALTSCFRRVIPMGVATGGVWTMNLRAARHIIGMRSAEAAEEEIAYVIGLIAKEMVGSLTGLMGDFERDERGFWQPKHWKV